MTTEPKRYLLVNADDFGMSPGVNKGIAMANQAGIVRNASLMVRAPAAQEAAEYAAGQRTLSLGLHIDLGEWVYVDDGWIPLYAVVSPGDARAVGIEIHKQLARFQSLTGRNPTHIDSHQHVHLQEFVHSIAEKVALELGVPLRRCHPRINYCGDFYGQNARSEPWPQGITVEALLSILGKLPVGITELCCHPGYDDGLATPYRVEREEEVQTLCDPRILSALDNLGIELLSFDSLASVLQNTDG
ncbi:MAG: chitin disaccharide deacetylase [Chloroflexota bacterium]